MDILSAPLIAVQKIMLGLDSLNEIFMNIQADKNVSIIRMRKQPRECERNVEEKINIHNSYANLDDQRNNWSKYNQL
jgi:hypothetical protein